MQAKVSGIFLSFLVSGIFISLMSPAHAQLGQISGTVVDEEGNPIEGVQIEIQGMEVKRNYKVKTKKDGKFLHAGVALQGTYRVIAKKDGYRSDFVQGVRPSFGGDDERGTVQFVLKEGASGALAFEMTPEEIERLRKQREEQEKKVEEFEAMKATFDQGVTAYNNGDYEAALRAFQTASEKDSNQAAVWAYLGNTYTKMERYEEGIDAYQKAVQLTPDDPALYQNLGNLYASIGETDKAKEHYEKSAGLSAATDPTAAATTFYNMGVTYINSGQNQEAAESLEKALEIDPNHAEAHYQLGLTLLGLNRMDESLQHLQKYVELAPSGPNVETAKALIQQLGG